ncbi:MAG: hypothetical protein ACKOE2_16030 [Actinomycetales bacterium]
MASDSPNGQVSASSSPSPDALADEVAAAREALVASMSELREQVAPGQLAARAGRAVGAWFTKPEGGIRPERVAIAAGVVLGLVALTALSRRRR